MKRRPESVNILGIDHKIEYFERPSDVDLLGRKSLWGCLDPWSCSIRVYDREVPDSFVFKTILHEVMHELIMDMKASRLSLDSDKDEEDLVELLAAGLSDVLLRNEWVKLEV